MRVYYPGLGGSLGECVLCGQPFAYEVLMSKPVRMIHVEGFARDLPVHTKCLPNIKNGDWKDLPEGPLRKEFARASKEVIR